MQKTLSTMGDDGHKSHDELEPVDQEEEAHSLGIQRDHPDQRSPID